MQYWNITVWFILEFVSKHVCDPNGHGHHGGGGHHHGGNHGQHQNHHHNHGGINPSSFGGWGGGIYPQYLGSGGGNGWSPIVNQIYPYPNNNNFGQNEHLTSTTSAPKTCPRPTFSDDAAELIIEKCDTEEHKTCWDSSSRIPIGWKVFMRCTQRNIRIKQPSTCSSNGEWSQTFPQTCTTLFEKYTTISEMETLNKLPLNLVHHSSTTLRSVEVDDDFKIIPNLKNHEKQCPMLKMHLSENFIFSCFMHHQSSVETHNCITNHVKVPSGTIALLRCKPPMYNRDGNHSQWICDNGAWEGDFDQKLQCIHSKVPIKSKPYSKTTTTITPTFHRITTTTRPRTTSSTTTRQPQKITRTTTRKSFITTTVKIPVLTTTPSKVSEQYDEDDDDEDDDDYDYVDIHKITSNTKTTTTTTTPKPKLLLTTTTFSPEKVEAKVYCPPLKPRSEGMVLECVSKTKASETISETVFVNGCDIPQPVGAEAKYSCRQYYESTGGLVSIYRKCKDDRTWSGDGESFNCGPQCGVKNEVFVPLITSGTPSFRNEWPWHTALFQKDSFGSSSSSWDYICGGTLISRKAIITASHCVTFQKSSIARNTTAFRFDLGRFDLNTVDDIIQTKEVESIHLHPSYSPFGFDSDIAIVILKEKVGIGYHVRPVCFPQSINTAQEDLMLDEGSTGTVVGFGKTENGKVSDQLRTAKLRVISQKECSAGTRGTSGGRLQIKSTTYCAAPNIIKNDTGIVYENVCNGDSGGGMVFPQQTTSDSISTRWYIQGIVSVGIGDVENNKCQPNRYSFFTRVGRYADWLIRVMSENDAL